MELLGNGFGPDGHLNLCAPTHRSTVIPIFSYVWISALYENYLYSGEETLLHQFAQQLKIMIDQTLMLKDSNSGLIKLPDPAEYWNFCEWVDGLDGMVNKDGKENIPSLHEIQAPHNLYVYEMLSSYIKIMHVIGNFSEENRIIPIRIQLGQDIEKYFWSDRRSCYLTRHKTKFHLHEHVQYLMLALDLVPDKKKRKVISTLKSQKLTKLTFSPLLYMMKALFKQSSAEQEHAVEIINNLFEKMLEEGATTFWETEDGASAFENAGSLCHAWSCIHVYYYGAIVLGVRPLTAGFKKFEVKPYPGKLSYAKGTVPTPAGEIQIEWQKRDDNSVELKVCHPAELTTEIKFYEQYPISKTYIKKHKKPRK